MRPPVAPAPQPDSRYPVLYSFGPIGWTQWDDTSDELVVYPEDGSTRYWRRIVFGLYRRVS